MTIDTTAAPLTTPASAPSDPAPAPSPANPYATASDPSTSVAAAPVAPNVTVSAPFQLTGEVLAAAVAMDKRARVEEFMRRMSAAVAELRIGVKYRFSWPPKDPSDPNSAFTMDIDAL